jgi:hypothetical protein
MLKCGFKSCVSEEQVFYPEEIRGIKDNSNLDPIEALTKINGVFTNNAKSIENSNSIGSILCLAESCKKNFYDGFFFWDYFFSSRREQKKKVDEIFQKITQMYSLTAQIKIFMKNGNKETVKRLAQRIGVRAINRPNKDGLTILEEAIKSGYVDMAKILMEHGAKPRDRLDTPGCMSNPLHQAIREEKFSRVQRLAKKFSVSLLAIQLAEKRNANQEMVDFLVGQWLENSLNNKKPLNECELEFFLSNLTLNLVDLSRSKEPSDLFLYDKNLKLLEKLIRNIDTYLKSNKLDVVRNYLKVCINKVIKIVNEMTTDKEKEVCLKILDCVKLSAAKQLEGEGEREGVPSPCEVKGEIEEEQSPGEVEGEV